MMETIRVYESSVDERAVARAVDALKAGRLIVYPTDTHYAIGCNALDNRVVEEICRLKGLNPKKAPLSVVCSGLSQASEYARIDNAAYRLMKDYLPGPFTFILPAATTLPKVFKGRREVGIRVPASAVARALAESLGAPLLSTTASEAREPDEVAEAVMGFNVALMLDAGEAPTDEGSTVINAETGEVLRPGAGIFDN